MINKHLTNNMSNNKKVVVTGGDLKFNDRRVSNGTGPVRQDLLRFFQKNPKGVQLL